MKQSAGSVQRRRTAVLVTGVLLVAMTLSACGSGTKSSSSTTTTAPDVTVTVVKKNGPAYDADRR